LSLNVEEVDKILHRDDLAVVQEEDVFRGMMKWIDHDSENRKKHFHKLLQCIRLTLISPVFIKDKIEPLCDDKCIKLFDVYKWYAMPSHERSLPQNKRENSNANSTILAIGGSSRVSKKEALFLEMTFSNEFLSVENNGNL